MIPIHFKAQVLTRASFSYEKHPCQTRISWFSAVNPATVKILFS
jgi:hypothetical protein